MTEPIDFMEKLQERALAARHEEERVQKIMPSIVEGLNQLLDVFDQGHPIIWSVSFDRDEDGGKIAVFRFIPVGELKEDETHDPN